MREMQERVLRDFKEPQVKQYWAGNNTGKALVMQVLQSQIEGVKATFPTMLAQEDAAEVFVGRYQQAQQTVEYLEALAADFKKLFNEA